MRGGDVPRAADLPDDEMQPGDALAGDAGARADAALADAVLADDARTARRPDAPGPARAGDLPGRLMLLAPGHPSSPYEADGSRRPPVIRLRDLELPETAPDKFGDEQPPGSADRAQDDRADQELASNPDHEQPNRPDSSCQSDQAYPDEQAYGDEPAYQADQAYENEPTAETDLAHEADAIDKTDRAHEIRPLTDAEHAEHVAEVRARLEKARTDGLATDQLYTLDPDGEAWSRDRRTAHDAIINDLYAAANEVPNEHRGIIAGGLSGAGKSTTLAEVAGIDRSQYLTVNPDDIKEELAQRGLIPEVNCLSPMEASDLVHEESSHVANQLALRAQRDGKNILWDITMSSRSSVERRVDELRSAGYAHVEGIFVEIPIETSASRVEARHRTEHDKYRAGYGLGGRLVPPEVISAQADQDWSSLNRKSFEEIKHRFETWSRYDNSVEGRSPMLVQKADRTAGDGDMHEETF